MLTGVRREGARCRLLRVGTLLGGLWLVPPTPARAQWAVEGFLGTAVSAHSPLTIYQDGQPTIHFTAHYETRPTEPWIYYALRVSHWWGRWGAFVGNIHHKIYLTNNPPEVENFQVTNGYNLFGIGAGYLTHGWTLLGSVGPNLPNPGSTVRGLQYSRSTGIFHTGYELNGVNVQLGVNRRFYVWKWAFVTADFRVSAAWSNVTVAEGYANTPNYAAHILVGIGGGNRRPGGATSP